MSCHPWQRKQNYRHSLKEKKRQPTATDHKQLLDRGWKFCTHLPFSMLEFCLVWTSTGVVPRKGKIWLTWIVWKVKSLRFKKTSLLWLLLLTFWLVISAWQDTFLFLQSDRRSFRLYFKHSSALSPWFGTFLSSCFLLLSSFIFTYIKSDHTQEVDRGNRIRTRLPSACLSRTPTVSVFNLQKD